MLNCSPSLPDYRYDKVESSITRPLIGPVSSTLMIFGFNFFLLLFSHHCLIYRFCYLRTGKIRVSIRENTEVNNFPSPRWPRVDFWLGFNFPAGRSPLFLAIHTPPILRSSNYFCSILRNTNYLRVPQFRRYLRLLLPIFFHSFSFAPRVE